MKPDAILSWKDHIRKGNVWRVQVELSMQDTPGGDLYTYVVEVHVVATTQSLDLNTLYLQCIPIMS